MKKQILISLGVSVLTIISLLLLFLTFMEGRFFPGTMVNQVDLSLMKREEAAEEEKRSASSAFRKNRMAVLR